MQFQFVLTGESALLMHADDIEKAESVIEWRLDPDNANLSVKGDDRSPPWTWFSYMYTDNDLNVCIPFDNLMACLRKAGAKVLVPGGKNNKTFKEETQSGIEMHQEFLELRCAGSNEEIEKGGRQFNMQAAEKVRDKPFGQHLAFAKDNGFRLWAKRAKIGQSKHVRVRARFDHWRVTGSATAILPEFTKEILQKIFDLAGKVGLCDWRPGCKTPGTYGKFSSVLKFTE